MTKAQRIADAIKRALEVRAGEVLTPNLIRDRAGNGAHYVMEALLAHDEEERTPQGYEIHEMEQHARKVIT